MKSSSFVFCNTIPEIEYREKDVRIDFGLVVLEMSYMEVNSLLTNLFIGLESRGKPFILPSRGA